MNVTSELEAQSRDYFDQGMISSVIGLRDEFEEAILGILQLLSVQLHRGLQDLLPMPDEGDAEALA